MPQLSTHHFIPPDPDVFPEGFEISLEALAAASGVRRPLLDVLPGERRAVYVHKVPDNTPEVDLIAAATGKPQPCVTPPIDRPYDKQKQWSILILDEGEPTPNCTHFKRHFEQNTDPFTAHYQKAPLSCDQLTLTKLRRLMERFTGKLSDSPPLYPDKGPRKPVHRLNSPALEQLDVLTGLLDYADQGPDFEKRLNALYCQLPKDLRPWGPALVMSHLRDLSRELRSAAARVTDAE